MMNAGNLKGKTRQTSDWRRRMIAFVSALTLLISSCGLTAFAESDEDIYSNPVTAPIPAANTSPEPEEGEAQATPAPEGQPEEGTEPQEAAGEGTEPEGEPEVSEEPEDLTVYEPGTLTAEADGVGITVDYTAEARMPEGAVLTLTRAAGGDLYNALKSASKVLKPEEDATWKRELGEDAVFYAITLTDSEGNEIHPETGVTLTCTNLEIPADAAGFVTGDNAENLDWKDTLTVGFLPDAIGYAYPKQVQIGTVTLTHEDRDYMVTAAYGPDAGFPADTELKVREILPGTPEYALYSGMTDEALNEDWAEITLERYFDIAFIANGEEMEPKADVDVQIVFRDKIEQNEETEVAAVHIENNEANVIEAETDSTKSARHDDEAIDTVTFTSDSFSVYGVVQKKKIITKDIMVEGESYTVNVEYTEDTELPVDTDLRVREIPKDSEEYNNYLDQIEQALPEDNVEINFARLFDIELYDGETKIEPSRPVKVTITQNEAIEITEETTLSIVHFAENGTEVIDDLSANADGTEITYQQDSFSVTAVVHYTRQDKTRIHSGRQYILSVLYNGNTYVIMNDGTLEKATNVQNYRSTVEQAFLWTYEVNNGREYLYHAADAYAFAPDTKLPTAWHYRYINPASATGVTTETGNQWSAKGNCGFLYNERSDRNYQICTLDKQYYIGVEAAADGTLHIVGQRPENQSCAVIFMSPEYVYPADNCRHSVNHIDIEVEGEAQLTMPLTAGMKYRLGSPDATLQEVAENTTIPMKLKETVGIDVDDIKGATLVATDKNGNLLNNVFYITGYTGNAPAEAGQGIQSKAQVRIEGSFKVADLRGKKNGNGQDLDPYFGNWWDANNDPDVQRLRRENPIYYSISLTKNVTFYWKLGGQQLYGEDKQPLKTTIPVELAARFNYWDETNVCPPIRSWGEYWNWKNNRHIVMESNGHHNQDSGMDFVLSSKENTSNGMPAVHITKHVRSTDGEIIKTDQELKNTFDIYSKSELDDSVIGKNIPDFETDEFVHNYTGFTHASTKTITLGPDGVGMTYAYNIPEGMVYIQERTPVASIVDKDGNVWEYDHTRVETESVFRNMAAYDNKMHISKDYRLEDNIRSMPEILGEYTYSNWENIQEKVNNEPVKPNNRFLEVHVYNIYRRPTTSITVKKEWTDGNNNHEADPVTLKLYRYKKGIIQDTNKGSIRIIQSFTGNGSETTTFIAQYTIKKDSTVIANGTGSYNNKEGLLLNDLEPGTYTINVIGSDSTYNVTTQSVEKTAIVVAGSITKVEINHELNSNSAVKLGRYYIKNFWSKEIFFQGDIVGTVGQAITLTYHTDNGYWDNILSVDYGSQQIVEAYYENNELKHRDYEGYSRETIAQNDGKSTITVNAVAETDLIVLVNGQVNKDQQNVFNVSISSGSSSSAVRWLRFRAEGGNSSIGSGSGVPNDYGKDTTFTNADIVLNSSNDWSVDVPDLLIYDENGDPYYYVIEEPNVKQGYEVSYEPEASAATLEDIVLKAVNTLKEPETGRLTVSKTITGNAANTSKSFSFTVTAKDSSDNIIPNGVYGDMTFTNGTATFTLSNGDSITASNLPGGTVCTVSEDAEGYSASVTNDSGTIISGDSTSRTIVAGETKTVAFTNTLNGYGDLILAKTVTGEGADKDKPFTFVVTLTDHTGEESYSTEDGSGTPVGTLLFNDGVSEDIILKDGESLKIKNLPHGTAYTTVEKEADLGGYRTSIAVTSSNNQEVTHGTISMGETETVVYTNEKYPTVNITATKAWTGEAVKEPTAIQFALYQNGNVANIPGVDSYLTITKTGGTWSTAVWNDLPKYVDDTVEQEQLETYAYSAKETGVYFGELTQEKPEPEADEWLNSEIYNRTESEVEYNGNEGTIIITNSPSTVDVPVEKQWPDLNDTNCTWTATFRLKHREIGIEDNPSSDPAPIWTVDDDKTISVTSENNGTVKFESLPAYRIEEDGTIHRILYSVDEISYEIYDENHTIVGSWYSDGSGEDKEYNDKTYRIYYNQNAGENLSATDLSERYWIIVENRPVTNLTGLVVRKEWLDVLPGDLAIYPEVYFTLYRVTEGEENINQATVIEEYKKVALNKEKNWTKAIEGLPDHDEVTGKKYKYFVIEIPADHPDGGDGQYGLNILTGGDYDYSAISDWKFTIDGYRSRDTYGQGSWKQNDYYMTVQNDSYTNQVLQEGRTPYTQPNLAAVYNGGEIVIRNCARKYMQMDIKKKFLWYNAAQNNSLYTTTSTPEMMNGLVIEVQVMRRALTNNAPGNVPPEGGEGQVFGWEPYGSKILVGYNENGDQVCKNSNPFRVRYCGPWHWTIDDENQDQGLLAYGIYKQGDSIIPVRYQYLILETNAYKYEKGQTTDEYDWVAVLPWAWDGNGSQVKMYECKVAQDQDRLINHQASDLEIEKKWSNGKDWINATDIEAVYIKVYRYVGQNYNGESDREDYTNFIGTNLGMAFTTTTGAVSATDGYLAEDRFYNGREGYGRYIQLDAQHPSAKIEHVLLMKPNGSTDVRCHYWAVECGYKPKGGEPVWFDEMQGDNLNPEYSIGPNTYKITNNKISEPVISLGEKGNNKIIITNPSTIAGSLKVTKHVQLNGTDTAVTENKTFKVGIYEKNGNDWNAVQHEVGGTNADWTQEITVTTGNATSYVIFEPLEIGKTYRIYELDAQDQIVTDRYLDYEVTYDAQPECTITGSNNAQEVNVYNNKKTKEIKAKKFWPEDQEGLPTDTEVKLRIIASVPGTEPDETDTPNGVTINPEEVTLDGKVTADEYETIAWEYTWTNLPVYDLDSKLITYTVEETYYKLGGKVLTQYATANVPEHENYDFSFTNTLPTKNIIVTKDWSDGNSKAWPDGIKTVTIGLYRINKDIVSEYPNMENPMTGEIKKEDNPKQVTFTDLPVYDTAGNVIVYSIKELSITPVGDEADPIPVQDGHVTMDGVDSWTVSIADVNDSNSATVTNTKTKVDIKILKVDNKDTTKALTGAKFKLDRQNGVDADGKPEYTPYLEEFEITEATGIYEMKGLRDGHYQLTETVAPTGYIGLNTPIEFTILNGEVQEGYSNTVTYIPDDKTFTIGNTPGAELPSTGGSGTLIYTITGIFLITLAGTLLVARKRKANR